MIKKSDELRLDTWHHFWLGCFWVIIGLIILLFAFVDILTGTSNFRMWALIISGGMFFFAGTIAMADDMYQHIHQRKDPEYRSPLHRLYGSTFWKVGWIRRLNEWIDRVLN